MLRAHDVIVFQGASATEVGRDRAVVEANNSMGLGRGYPMLVAARLLAQRPGEGLRFFNRGVSGDKVTDLLPRWRQDCLALRPTVVSIMIGVNDTWKRFFPNGSATELDEYERCYRKLLDMTREQDPSARFVLCEQCVLRYGEVTQKWYPEFTQRQAIVRKLAGEYGAVFVPFQEVLDEAAKKAPPQHWAPDGVHPSAAGHWLLAEAWLKAVGEGGDF